jgi:hypothetical protein
MWATSFWLILMAGHGFSHDSAWIPERLRWHSEVCSISHFLMADLNIYQWTCWQGDRMHPVRPLRSLFHPAVFISMLGQAQLWDFQIGSIPHFIRSWTDTNPWLQTLHLSNPLANIDVLPPPFGRQPSTFSAWSSTECSILVMPNQVGNCKRGMDGSSHGVTQSCPIELYIYINILYIYIHTYIRIYIYTCK